MSRKSYLLAFLVVLLLSGSVAATMGLLLTHEPSFYQQVAVPEGQKRRELSGEFQKQFTNNLITKVMSEQDWVADFTEAQINSYLVEEFLKGHSSENPLPEGISEPRVCLEKDRIRLGFRYGVGRWSTVISIDMHPWLVHKEPNVIALEFKAMKAGAVPVSAQWLLDRMAQAAHRNQIDASFYRYNRNQVILMRFEANRSQPTFRLRELRVAQGKMSLAGKAVSRASRG